MRAAFLTLFMVMAVFSLVYSQEIGSIDFYKASNSINTTGMYVLGGWAVANMTGGAIGWAKTTGSTKYFHQMNLFWNTVNLGIAGFALSNSYNIDLSALSHQEMMAQHLKTENLFLINAGLDVVYMGTGFFLKYLSTNNATRHDLLKGYGNSLLLQGGYLMLFDVVMYGIQHQHRLDFLKSADLTFLQQDHFSQLAIMIRF
jgi:hypothetical protein